MNRIGFQSFSRPLWLPEVVQWVKNWEFWSDFSSLISIFIIIHLCYNVKIFTQEQSDKDDEAIDANEDGEPVAKKSKKMFEEQAIPSEVFGSLKKDE